MIGKSKSLAAGSLAVALMAGGLVVAGASPAAADVERDKSGRCTGSSSYQLDLEKERNRIEVDLEIDSRTRGERWAVKVRHNGKVFYDRARITDDDGEFDVDRRVPNRKGKDTISFTATSSSGEKCTGSLRI